MFESGMLQPSVLDRLTADEQFLSPTKLRERLLRDVAYLLNTTNFVPAEELARYPYVADSVLNYGVPPLTSTTLSGVDPGRLEQQVLQALWRFEPRLLRESLTVKVVASDNAMGRNSVTLEIQAHLAYEPLVNLHLVTEVDLESGSVQVVGLI